MISLAAAEIVPVAEGAVGYMGQVRLKAELLPLDPIA
jgi:hypothetical protein